MVNFIACHRCGKIFQQTIRNVCEKCYKGEEKLFEVVLDFVIQHPGVTLYEVSEETGFDPIEIEGLINSGRLVRAGVKILYRCRTCERMISSGSICERCKREINEKMKEIKCHSVTDEKIQTSTEGENEEPDEKKDLQFVKQEKQKPGSKRKKKGLFHRLAE